MICVHCQYVQEVGNFCTVCGNPFYEGITSESQSELIEVSYESNQEPSVTRVTRIHQEKDKTKRFSAHVKEILKQPAKAFSSDESLFTYGIWIISFYIFAFALSFYFLANKLYTLMLGGVETLFTETGYQQSLPFLNLTSSIIFFVTLVVLSAFLSIYLGTKLMGEGISIKLLTAQYGSMILPFTVVNIIALGFGLAGASVLTVFATAVSLFFVTAIIPALFVYQRGIASSRTVNVLYWSMGTTAASLLISYMIVHFFVFDFVKQFNGLPLF